MCSQLKGNNSFFYIFPIGQAQVFFRGYVGPSVPGKNLTLSLDIDLQMLGERLLKNKIGSVVAIEPETGEILCLVSSPNYDPHLMIGRQRGKNHQMCIRDRSGIVGFSYGFS